MIDDERSERAEFKMRRMSRRSFTCALIAAFGTYGSIRWIATRRNDMGVPWPLRRSLDFTDALSTDLLQRSKLEPKNTKPDEPVRVNGDVGNHSESTRETYQLTLSGVDEEDVKIGMAAILKMPKMTMLTELHCIEGWTQTVKWAGVPLAAFLAQHPPKDADNNSIGQGDEDYPEYLYMESEDGEYYVGLDMQSALHSQTMLCYEMNGQPLPKEHGGPLRLVIPVKYGVKNIKWLGTIRYSSDRPKDYWAEQGYDWFAGQ